MPPGEKMENLEARSQKKRILLLSDIHGNIRAFQQLVNNVKLQKMVDCILIAGDIAGTICYPLIFWSILKERKLSRPLYAKLVYGRARAKFIMFQIKTIHQLFEKLKQIKIPTVLTFGNTDTPEAVEVMRRLADSIEHIHFLHTGDSVSLSGLYVIAIGGATQQIMNREFNCPHDYSDAHYAELVNKVRESFSKHSNKHTILLTHEAPVNTCADRLLHSNYHSGSNLLYQAVISIQPLIHVCGHFHESQGACKIGESTLINPGAVTHYEYALCEVNLGSSKRVIPRLFRLSKRVGDPVELIYRFHRRLDFTT